MTTSDYVLTSILRDSGQKTSDVFASRQLQVRKVLLMITLLGYEFDCLAVAGHSLFLGVFLYQG
jgi:hypothetical protein